MTIETPTAAYVRYDGNGSTTQFTFSFTKFEDDDVVVYLFNSNTGNFDLNSSYTISGSTITFNTAPPAGTGNVLIFRRTDFNASKVPNFNPGSSIRGEDLDKNFLQSLRVDQEFRDLKVDKYDPEVWANLDMNNSRISELAEGTTDTDAVTRGQLGKVITEDLIGSSTITLADTTGGSNSNKQVTISVANSSIGTSKLNNNAVTTAKIADGAVTSAKIADGTITDVDISGGAAIDGSKLNIELNDLSNVDTLPNNGEFLKWTGSEWVSGAVAGALGGTVTNIATGTGLTGGPIILNGTVSIANGGVDTTQLADNAVTTAKITGNAVTTDKITDNAVTTDKITDNAVTTAKIANTAVTAGKLATSSVTSTKIADNSVTDAKITDNAVTTAKIANTAVTTAKIASTAVTGGKLATSSVTTTKIADNSVTAAKLANTAVTAGSYTSSNITVDAQGRLTAASSGTEVGTISVKDYGATGDGSTNDYSAITSAIAAAAGKTLIFPKGTYSVSQTIIFDQSDSIIRGEGQVTITMPASTHRNWSVANVGKSTVGTANAISPVERVLIENITFDFNDDRRDSVSGTQSSQDDAYKKNACTIANAKYITMRNCRFLDGFRHCLDISTPIKKNVGSLTRQQKWLQMPVLPNIGGTELFGAQYITIENCYFKGGGDDNLTTHYCSDVLITGCRSESPHGGYSDTGDGNHNGFEIDDGSRNIILTNSVAIKCMSGIEVKAHEYFPAPYNIMIDACRIINCTEPIEIHHTGWEGPVSGTGNADDAELGNAFHHLFSDTSGTVTLGAGTDQEVVCTDGISPMARNVSVSNVQIIAPATFSYYTRDSNNNFTAATKNPERCFEVGNYDGVLISNITFNDGRNDVALSDIDGYVQPSAFGASGPGSTSDVGLIHLHNGCRNVSFSNIQVTGFGGASPLTEKVFQIQSNCFDAINCSNLTVVDGPEKIVNAGGSSQAYFGAFRGVQVRSATTRNGPALDSTNDNLRFEQPDIRGYTNTVNVNELVLEKSTSTPGSGRGKGSVHVNETTGVIKVKTTNRSSSDWNCLGALAWARYDGSSDSISKSFNIASITRNSTGNYTVTLSNNLSFASENDFCAQVTASQHEKVNTPAITNGQASFVIKTLDNSGGLTNASFMNVVVFGETSN